MDQSVSARLLYSHKNVWNGITRNVYKQNSLFWHLLPSHSAYCSHDRQMATGWICAWCHEHRQPEYYRFNARLWSLWVYGAVPSQWINNHSDYQGRYTYQQQPSIGHWNLWMWLNNLIPLCPENYDEEQWKQDLAQCLEHYEPTFLEHYKHGLNQKWLTEFSQRQF